MEKQNLILVFDKGLNRMLMCKRSKAPYQGLLNLARGKVEPKEDSVSAAYCELVPGKENRLFWLPIQDYCACSGWLAGDGNVIAEIKRKT